MFVTCLIVLQMLLVFLYAVSIMDLQVDDPYNSAEEAIKNVLSRQELKDKVVSIYVVSGEKKAQSRINFMHLLQCLAVIEGRETVSPEHCCGFGL